MVNVLILGANGQLARNTTIGTEGASPPRRLLETEGSPQHRDVEALRLRLACFVMLDLCQQEIEPLARRPFPPGTLARRGAAQGRDLLAGWRGRLPGRYV